jgi:GTP cyclohydrolase I
MRDGTAAPEARPLRSVPHTAHAVASRDRRSRPPGHATPAAQPLGARPGGDAGGTAASRADFGIDLDSAPAHDAEFEQLVRRQLELLGEDPRREGLVKTPQRVATSLTWLTRGYGLEVRDVIGDALFEESHESMVMVRDIELYSLCEHHLLPFFGKAHVAYIPDGRIVGLSKLPRVVEVFARRLQVQERLTEQIAQALTEVLRPKGVGVVIEAQHLCMMMRGVEKQNSKTITSAMHGSFRTDGKTRDEFLRLAHGPSLRSP